MEIGAEKIYFTLQYIFSGKYVVVDSPAYTYITQFLHREEVLVNHFKRPPPPL